MQFWHAETIELAIDLIFLFCCRNEKNGLQKQVTSRDGDIERLRREKQQLQQVHDKQPFLPHSCCFVSFLI